MISIVLLIALSDNYNGQDLKIAVYETMEECQTTIGWMMEHSAPYTSQLICEPQ